METIFCTLFLFEPTREHSARVFRNAFIHLSSCQTGTFRSVIPTPPPADKYKLRLGTGNNLNGLYQNLESLNDSSIFTI